MSRGFVKEGDQEEVPLVTPRPHLPPGVENYVTSQGLQALKEEREQLQQERSQYSGIDNSDARVRNNYINAKLSLLEERIKSARVLDFDAEKQKNIAFGATITFLKSGSSEVFKYQIVGVDEANIAKGKISFLSPLSKVLLNKTIGDKINFKTPTGEQILEIKNIE